MSHRISLIPYKTCTKLYSTRPKQAYPFYIHINMTIHEQVLQSYPNLEEFIEDLEVLVCLKSVL